MEISRWTWARRLALLVLTAAACLGTAAAQDKWGVLVLHGKNPGSANDPSTDSLIAKLQATGAVTLKPDMPWSRTRYLDKPLDGALAEMAAHVQTLRAQGATRIALAGHSMGCPAAMAYAAQRGGVDALVLMAPGHVPQRYYNNKQNTVVHDSVDLARDMVARGEGDKANTPFSDINQGRKLTVMATPALFLSYFDPQGDGEMSVTAPRIPVHTAVLWAIGKADPLFSAGRAYVFDKLPAHPKHQYLEVDANHLTTPTVAAEAVVQWLGSL